MNLMNIICDCNSDQYNFFSMKQSQPDNVVHRPKQTCSEAGISLGLVAMPLQMLALSHTNQAHWQPQCSVTGVPSTSNSL